MPYSNRERQVTAAVEFIQRHFPELGEVMKGCRPTSLGYGVGDGVCSHPDEADAAWFCVVGFAPFSGADISDGFCFVGIQNTGNNEALIAMWEEAGRRFWFYEIYACFSEETNHSPAATRATLQHTLGRWAAGAERVTYSGPSGMRVNGSMVASKDDMGIPYL